MPASGVTLHACTQGGWLWTDILAGVLKVAADKVRILTPDVGGGFGMKAFFYPEYALAAFAARELGRPVKWTGERSETFLADVMGRDHVTEAALALDADHRIIGLHGRDHRQHGRLQLAVRAVHPDHGGAQGPARRVRRQEAWSTGSRAC